jgi:hypothetical protein
MLHFTLLTYASLVSL